MSTSANADADRDAVLRVVRRAVEAFNAGRAPAEPALEFAEDAPLLGRDARLDSLGLVTLVVEIEFQVRRAFGLADVLSSDAAMSRHSSPFRTLGTVVDFVVETLRA